MAALRFPSASPAMALAFGPTPLRPAPHRRLCPYCRPAPPPPAGGRGPCPCAAEMEADLIGMMLLGSAGFDPRIAPLAIEKLGDSNRGFLCTHPSNKKRSQLLSETEIMELALKLYREVNPHQNTERSLQVKF
ncbi:hypothetical protein BRADI_3g16610v3 [Brachypodium distachyon]|uniref:Peptidase M48 domain-containing protein n=1 Tax=Brachypodium distachyon TaxID=15368 RepID=I1I1G4_BRADI|nr:hypothetical protein BRADI_3g16610v3 [Brachypodium distachyon]